MHRSLFRILIAVCAFSMCVHAMIISTVPVTITGKYDTGNYFQNLTYGTTGALPDVERLTFSFTVEPLEYNEINKTKSVRSTLDMGFSVNAAYAGPGLRMRAAMVRGYCRYADPSVIIIDSPLYAGADMNVTQVSTDELLCDQIYHATIALEEETTETSIALTEILNLLHVSERNIPCIPIQLRCPNFEDYAYPPNDGLDTAIVERSASSFANPDLSNTPFANMASVGGWEEDNLAGPGSVIMNTRIFQNETKPDILTIRGTFGWTAFGFQTQNVNYYGYSTYTMNVCQPTKPSIRLLQFSQAMSSTEYVEFTNTCGQGLYLDMRLFSASTFGPQPAIDEALIKSVLMVENYGQLYQTVSGFDGAVCVRIETACTPFFPLNAVAVVENHDVLVGSISFLATNFPNYTTTRLVNTAENRTPFYVIGYTSEQPSGYGYENGQIFHYNVSTTIRRVQSANNTAKGGISFSVKLEYDYNTTFPEPYSPGNATLVIRAFRNFCGVNESSPSFIGKKESALLSRNVSYIDQSLEALFDLDSSMCGQNMHLQIRFEARGTPNDIWLTSITYGKYTAHGNKDDRSMCIQYYVDCETPILPPPGTFEMIPGYTGMSTMQLLILAGIVWGSLAGLLVLVEISVGFMCITRGDN